MDQAELFQVLRGYQPAALVIGLVELDVCGGLTAYSGGVTAAELARSMHLEERPLAALLAAAAALGILLHREGSYSNTALSSGLLVKGAPGYIGNQVRTQVDQYRGWLDLARTVRDGRPVLPNLQADVEGDPALRRLILGLHSGGQSLLPRLTPLLAPYLSQATHLLDLGSGAGTFGVGWAEQYSRLEVTLLDRPGVIELAREVTATSPARSRLHFWPTDYRSARLEVAAFDLILFFQVLRTEPPAVIRPLLAQAAQALRPGGHLAIYDTRLENDRTGPLDNVFQNLAMTLMYEQGGLFTRLELTDWLAEVGLELIESWPVEAARPMTLYLAGRSTQRTAN